ncbi:MAG: hypothetical protein RIT45_319 [Pseudomonadota bacterium]
MIGLARLERPAMRRAALLVVALWTVHALVYALRLPLVMDELQGAFAAWELGTGVPYRDFVPYKTVLGYALQEPVLALWPGSWWAKLHAVRVEMALLAALGMVLAAHRLSALLRPGAVLLALVLWAAMSTWTERAFALRVDMLTALCGLAGLLALLEGRVVWAGFWSGLSLCVSQKGAYFVLAGGVGSVASAALARQGTDALRAAARAGLTFALAAAAPLLAYLAIFALLAGPGPVLDAVFLRNRAIALQNLYDLGIKYFWFQTFKRNPLFWGAALAGLALTVNVRRSAAASPPDLALGSYGAVLLLLALWHKQPWPYFFVMVVPTLFVLVARLFDHELGRDGRLGRLVLVVVLALGLALPLTRVVKGLRRDAGSQRAVVLGLERLLGPRDGYLAGMQALPSRRHVLDAQLGWLDARRMETVRRGDTQAIAAALRRDLPLLVVESYRTRGLPAPIRAVLDAETAPLCGALRHRVYRLGGTAAVQVPAGRYRLEGPGPVKLGDVAEPWQPGSVRSLPQGAVRGAGAAVAGSRLVRVADGDPLLADLDCRPEDDLFGGVYDW